jgi:penicillin-binding protein 1A
MKKTLRKLFWAGLFGAFVTIMLALFLFKKYSGNLPNYEQLKDYSPMITTRLYAADGSLITEFSREKRIFVPIEIIPKNLINAFLAAEDANFYEHSGVDPLAIFRTSIQNLFAVIKGDPGIGGASTITQQVVKNFLLSRERTLQRKVKEAILAFRMSKSFSKERILELYLNQIYLGSGSYGVAAAAKTYFNKSIDELTIEEDALLATLPKAPSKLDPRRNIEKAKIRRNWVIQRMIENKFILEKEGLQAMEKPITLAAKENDEVTKANFFADNVKKELIQLYGSDSVFESGIVVGTTLDSRLQKIAAAAFEKGIEEYDYKHGYRGPLAKIEVGSNWHEELKKFDIKKLYKATWSKAVVLSLSYDIATIGVENGALGSIKFPSLKWARRYINVDKTGSNPKKISDVLAVGDIILAEKIAESESYLLHQIPEVNGGFLAMDPHSGRVLAMMGGYIDAPNQFNRTTQALRQPGSTIKTFGYITALENGMTPATIIMDEEISLDQGLNLPPYKPRNYSGSFYGPTTLRTGLEKSRNVTTVRMADQVGLDKVVEVVKRFGINDNPQKIYSLVLGSTETTLLRLATAYSMMVNGGKKVTPLIIEKIQDRNGVTIYRRDKRQCKDCFISNLSDYDARNISELPVPFLDETKEQITDSATAYQITSLLQGAVERGTAGSARAIGKIIGGKTGTTNNSYDSWFIGFSPDLVATVYIGFDNPKSLGSDETGASVALPVFVNFMTEALKDIPSTPFRVPNTVKFVKIDRITGKVATPFTPKEQIFFEAFKLNDIIENSEINEVETEYENQEFEAETQDSNPGGIY